MRDAFSQYHPLVNLVYFVLVLAGAMCLMHPVCLAVSLTGGLCYCAQLRGRRGLLGSLRVMLPMLLLAVVLNPLFSREGATVLARLPWGAPLTLQSLVYGGAAGLMLCAVLSWFSCYAQVMTTDKCIYLFGRLIPALSLVLAMTMRFIPQFRRQLQAVSEAQRCLGREESHGGWRERMGQGVTLLSAVTSWSLEAGVETADSMRSRGYGLPGRTAFSLYSFEKRDRRALCLLIICGVCLVAGALAGGLRWQYFPTWEKAGAGVLSGVLWLLYLALCLAPVILNRREVRRWRHTTFED